MNPVDLSLGDPFHYARKEKSENYASRTNQKLRSSFHSRKGPKKSAFRQRVDLKSY